MPALDHLAAVDCIYRAAAERACWPEALATLSDYVGASGGRLAHHAPVPRQSFLVTGRLREDLNALYLEHYQRNPYILAYARAPLGEVQIANRLVNVEALRRSSFYADMMAPQGFDDVLTFTHAALSCDGGVGGISFMLSRRQAEAADEAAARLQALVPHLNRAIDLSLMSSRQSSSHWLAHQLLDAMSSAAVLLDENGAVIRANKSAEHLLRAADGVALAHADGWRLRAASPVEQRLLSARIAEALSAARGEEAAVSGSLTILRPSGRPHLVVMVTPLPPASFSPWEAVDGGARALVQIFDPKTPSRAQAQSLGIAAGLTEGEIRVAALIGGGYTIPETAAMLSLSTNTVKSHLSRCFAKTGTHSQAALARLVTAIPARPSEAD